MMTDSIHTVISCLDYDYVISAEYALVACLLLEILLELCHRVSVLFPVLVDVFNNLLQFCFYHLTTTDFNVNCMMIAHF